MTTLSDATDRVEVILNDTSNNRYSTDQIAEAFRRALAEYNAAYPNYAAQSITLAADGREIDLVDGSSNPLKITQVIRVYFPYDSSDETPTIHEAFYVYNVAGQPTMQIQGDYVPQNGDIVRIWYTTPHTMDGLDSASADTFPDNHLNILIIGAAAIAAMHRAAALSETIGSRASDTNQLLTWSTAQYDYFLTLLGALRGFSSRSPVFDCDSAWKLDAWDRPNETLRGTF